MVGRGASILPGSEDAPGTMTVLSDVLCEGCLIDFEVSSVFTGGFDVFEIDGAMTLLGDVLVTFHFIHDFAPITGESFDFLSAAAIEGLGNVTFGFVGFARGFGFDVVEDAGTLTFIARTDGVRARVSAPDTLGLLALSTPLLGWGYRWRQRSRMAPS